MDDLDKARIREICEQRGINELVHFTRVENLKTILQHGLLSRRDLNKLGLEYKFNDDKRYDGCLNAISLSISFPNYMMFWSIRQRSKDEDNWVVISISPEILWKMDCAFYPHNAASLEMSLGWRSQRKKAEAFECLFEDYPDVKRDATLPQSFPTNPQAEVLVFEKIPPIYIKKVYFRNDNCLRKWLNRNDNERPEIFDVNERYFKYRVDFAKWKKKDVVNNQVDSEIPF